MRRHFPSLSKIGFAFFSLTTKPGVLLDIEADGVNRLVRDKTPSALAKRPLTVNASVMGPMIHGRFQRFMSLVKIATANST